MKIKNICLMPLLVFSMSCTLTPKYKTPDMPVEKNWGQTDIYSSSGEFAENELELENFIKDKRLLTVINIALSGNRDLRVKIADIEAARALYRVERAKLLPSIYAGAQGGESKTLNADTSENYSAEIGVSAFEIDLFGKNRSMKNSKLQQYFASEKLAESARISLIAETASAWITLASDKEMLKIANDTVKSTQESVDITEKRFEAGVISKLDYYQAQTILQQAKSDVANYRTIVAQDINALELLSGEKISEDLLPEGIENIREAFGEISAGISSGILLRRPDIQAAEYNLKSANADIGAARAAFFPTISLVAATGLASNELSKLFSDGSQVWSYSGNINIPIFSGGSNISKLKYYKSKHKSYLAQYDKSIQTAFKEVKNALARRATVYDQLDSQKALLNFAKDGYNIARIRYENGIESYLNVLELQRTYYNAEKTMITTVLTEINNRITLYKTLGGGSEKKVQ